MRIVPGEEDVNFERVTKVYREESGKKTLVSLEADFYDKLAAYVARLDEAANKEAQKDPNSPKALLLQDEPRERGRRRDPELARARADAVREHGGGLEEGPRRVVRGIAVRIGTGHAASRADASGETGSEQGGSAHEGRTGRGDAPRADAAKPERPCPRSRTRGPPAFRRDRYDVSAEEGGRRHAPKDDRADPRGPRESPDCPDVRGDRVRSLTAFALCLLATLFGLIAITYVFASPAIAP